MISIKNATKKYKSKKGAEVIALNDLNIEIEGSGLVFIVGRSGCGKTTLLNCLGGLDRLDNGGIFIDGEDIALLSNAKLNEFRGKKIGFVFQEYNLIDHFTVMQNITLAQKVLGGQSDSSLAEKLMAELDISELKDRRADELSGGQRQRVAIVRALLKKPAIILADEPTGALDEETGEDLVKLLKAISKDTLVLVVTHDKETALKYGDRIIELADGRVKTDSVGKIKNDVDNGKSNTTVKTTVPILTKKRGLPTKDAISIGFKGLIRRKVRLVLSLVMVCISLIAFGLNLCIMNYSRSKVFLQTMYDQNNYFLTGTATTTDADKFYDSISGFDSTTFSYYNISNSAGFFKQVLAPDGLYELTESNAASFRFAKIAGEFPSADNDVMITEFNFWLYQQNGFTDLETGEVFEIKTYDDIIGKNVGPERLINHMGGFRVSGILDTNYDKAKYEALQALYEKERQGQRLSTDEIKAVNAYKSYFNNGAHSVMFVASGVLSKLNASMNYDPQNTSLSTKSLSTQSLSNGKSLITLNIITKGSLPLYTKNSPTISDYTGQIPSQIYWVGGQERSELAGNDIIIPFKMLRNISLYENPENVHPRVVSVDRESYYPALSEEVNKYAEENFDRIKQDFWEMRKSYGVDREPTIKDFAANIESWIASYEEDYDLIPELKKELFIGPANAALIEYCTTNTLPLQDIRIGTNPTDGSYYYANDINIVGFYMTDTSEDYTFYDTTFVSEQLYKIVAANNYERVVVALSGNYYKDLTLIKNSNTFREDEDGNIPIIFSNEIVIAVEDAYNIMQNFRKVLTYAFVAIAAIAFLLLLNFFSMGVADDKNMIIILRSLGATKKDLLRIYLLRSAALILTCLALSLVGVFVGTGQLNNYIIKRLGLLFTPLVFDFGIVAIVTAIALPLVLVATVIPVIKIIKGRLSRVSE